MSYRDLADRIRVSQPCTGASRVVAVDGPAGSGKSLFAERLSTVLSAKVICLDDLTPSWTGPDKEADLLVQQVLVPLSRGMAAQFHFFDWVKERYTEWRDVPPDPFLLVEGVGAGSRIVRPFVSQLIWVESPSRWCCSAISPQRAIPVRYVKASA